MPVNPWKYKYYACGATLTEEQAHRVWTLDGNPVDAGKACYRRIRDAGEAGWQPPKGGPRLYLENPLR